MNATTPQPFNDESLLGQLNRYFCADERRAVATLGERLSDAAGGLDGLTRYKLMVAYGGGKDSSYTVAMLRAAQLHLSVLHGRTFQLRIANMRHAGVPDAVMANIDRVYRALHLFDDPRVEMLVVDHRLIRPFERHLPFPDDVQAMNRFDVLMNGHRTAGDGRPTFCNSCNLAVADFYGRAAWWQGGVNAVVTGDSRKEQKHYFTWIMRLAQRLGLNVDECRRQGFRGLLQALDGVAQVYFVELFGEGFDHQRDERRVACGDDQADPAFISIYDLVSYKVEDHWELITEFLDFRFEELAFSFTESDCANPMLMAHFRGLKAQYVQGRSYNQGIAEYLELAQALMRKKEMPQRLIDLAMAAYADAEGMQARRTLAANFAEHAFGLDEAQLVCMQFAPFVDRGRELSSFLGLCHPQRLPELDALHQLLGGEREDAALSQWLTQVSGLPLPALRSLYAHQRIDFDSDATLIARVRAGDPHKGRISRYDPATGETVVELVSGR
ncbi:hypothetical protein CS078_22150 [Pseudomonas prosekii]|uniref:Uncharacterized protein n=1 Tax=Pseudomonas prosekii TaxID=1148509 RepID=A0A3L8CCL0_9PSED|nr:hypothetical protein [Pseudomonas prosekii]RLU05900.1 hypothetical protein CS076_22520 [Pseudomonas prosekii]RLU06140.1 hypothetical protein CS078_22150 [Pseudomonas prosekii]